MQRSTLLTVAGILIVISSCLALAASLFTGLFIWADYFHPSHLGSVRGISEAFYVEISITIFELSAFVLGLLSAVNTFKLKRFSSSALGASFLLISGLLFFAKFLYNYLPHVEAIFQSFWSQMPQPWFGLPIIIIASIIITLLASRRKKFDSKEINPLVALEAILILCSITSASFAIFSIVPYEQTAESARIQHSVFPNHTAYSLLATMIVSICTLIFSTLAGLLLFMKRRFYASVALIVLSLITALSLPFIFMSIYPWIGSFFKGLVTESPIIILSATALVLAILGQRNVTKQQSNTV